MASINGLDTDLLNVSVLNANENIFIRGETGTQGQVISYDANRKIEFSDVVNDNDNIAVVLPLVKSIAGDPPVHTVSLGYNTSDFQLDGSNLLELKDTIVDTAVLPLSISGDTVSLGFNANDFKLDIGSNLELKDTYVKNANEPLAINIAGGYATIDLEYNTSSFQLDGDNKLQLKNDPVITASNPLSVATGNVSLNFETADFQLSAGNKLELKDTYVDTAAQPLSISGDTITLDYNPTDFDVVGGELELKDTFVKTAVLPLFTTGGSITIRLNSEDIIKNQGGYTQFAESRYTNTMYYDTSEEKYYKILKPSDFLNDDDSSGYARVVIRDFTQPGSMSCYAGTQFYCFFEIPTGFKFIGFRINLVNSGGTPQGTTPTSTFYVSVKKKSIAGSFINVGANRGFNTANGGYDEEAIDIDDWELDQINNTYFYALHCFRNSWSNAYYLQGGYLEFERI
tara:strand:+ start:3702 stop:5069 length:1368 start_codon:yes stop_codon:yes gene_type:complete